MACAAFAAQGGPAGLLLLLLRGPLYAEVELLLLKVGLRNPDGYRVAELILVVMTSSRSRMGTIPSQWLSSISQ